MLESCKDIEVRVARIARDRGRKTGCLLKLYRNGAELPTARNIWVDFVLINDENTPYKVDFLYEINGKAYDVIIVDDQGTVYYNGLRRREHQNAWALSHGQPLPADTQEIEAYHAEQRRQSQAQVAERQTEAIKRRLAGKARAITLDYLRKPSHIEYYKKLFNVPNGGRLTEEQLLQVWNDIVEGWN
jgi:hypothetical protein